MQEHLNGLQEKVETLTETVADQEKNNADLLYSSKCYRCSSISFIGFCIYQGIKSEREKQKGLFQDVLTGELIDLREPGTKLNADVSGAEKLLECLKKLMAVN